MVFIFIIENLADSGNHQDIDNILVSNLQHFLSAYIYHVYVYRNTLDFYKKGIIFKFCFIKQILYPPNSIS